MEQDQRLQQETEREKTQAERLASGYYERGKLLETSREYGAVYTANVMLPDGRLGATERRSRFELREAEENKIEVVLRQRLYYRGDDIEPKELANRFVPRSEGKFGQLDEAQKHVRGAHPGLRADGGRGRVRISKKRPPGPFSAERREAGRAIDEPGNRSGGPCPARPLSGTLGTIRHKRPPASVPRSGKRWRRSSIGSASCDGNLREE